MHDFHLNMKETDFRLAMEELKACNSSAFTDRDERGALANFIEDLWAERNDLKAKAHATTA